MKKQKKHTLFVSCIIAGGGSGTRMGADVNKIFLDLDEIPVLAHTLSAFQNHPQVDEIILVTRECDILGAKDIAEEFGISKLRTIVAGGASRQESVANGLLEVNKDAVVVLVHDAARPLITDGAIREVIETVLSCGGAAVGAPIKSTVKEINADGFITRTPDRAYLYEVQTPQGFSYENIVYMYEQAQKSGISATDDCYLAERLGLPVKMIASSSDNIKITTYDDLLLAELIVSKRKGDAK